MKRSRIVSAGILGGALVGLVGWRFASRRRLLPCPHWLSVLLENPYVNAVASAETILDRLGVAPGMRVLDVGCGPGRLTVPAARRAGPTGSVTALDIQPEMLRRLQQKVEAAGLSNVHPIHAGAGQSGIEPASFDRALLVTVLGEIPDQKAAMREIFGALKPGGVLSVTEVLPDPHYQLRTHVRTLAFEAGFEERQSFSDGVAYTIHFAKPTRPSPPKIEVCGLHDVAKTLLVPIYYRALESRRPDAILRDPEAVSLIQRLDYDFSRLEVTELGSIFALLRMREIDRATLAFLAAHPSGIVVDIGCGLDTRFYRVDNGSATFYDLDFPEVIAIRAQLFESTPRRVQIGCSALDFAWMDRIDEARSRPILFIAEGVFPYLSEDEVKRLVVALCERFPGAELIFDALPPSFVRIGSVHPALRATGARLRFGLGDSKEPERWQPEIQLLREWRYIDEPEPRLRRYKLLRWLPPVGKPCIVHYRLGSSTVGSDPRT